MKKFLSFGLAIILTLGMSISSFAAVNLGNGTPVSGTVTTKTGKTTISGYYHKDQSDGMFFQINKIRKEAGLPELAYNSDLFQYAKQRALEITVSFSHTRPDGTRGLDIASVVNGENLGLSADDYLGTTGTYSDVVSSSPQSFMESESHRSLILDTDMKSMVCYCLEYDGNVYWVQLYSAQPGTTSTSTTSTTTSSTTSKTNSTTSTTTSATTNTTAATSTNTIGATALTSQVASAISSNKSAVVLTNVATIEGDAFAEVATASKSNKNFTIYCDTTYSNSSAVLGRIYLNTANMAGQKSNLDVQVLTGTADTKKIQSYFNGWYSNPLTVVKVGNAGTLAATCEIAVKADLTGLDTDNLVFTSYDLAQNTIRVISNPNYSIDANGYLHFNTSVGGYIVVSDGTLAA